MPSRGGSSSERTTLETAIQVTVGVAIVALIYLLSLWVMQRDRVLDHEVSEMRPTELAVDVLRGYGSAERLSSLRWSTANQNAGSFLPLLPSYNRRGGVQFTYSFWVKVDTRGGGAELANQVLLLRGDKRNFRWRRITGAAPVADGGTGGGETAEDFGPAVLVKCPLIRFGESFDELVVEYNTLHDPSSSFKVSSSPLPGPGERRNALSLMQGRWAMLTFAFEDNVGISSFEDGLMVRFYLNDALYHTHRQPGALRRNQGDFFLAPTFHAGNHAATAASGGLTMGDVRFFNYAVAPKDVERLFSRGQPLKEARELQQRGDADPLYLSEYNRLDIYNGGLPP